MEYTPSVLIRAKCWQYPSSCPHKPPSVICNAWPEAFQGHLPGAAETGCVHPHLFGARLVAIGDLIRFRAALEVPALGDPLRHKFGGIARHIAKTKRVSREL